MKLRFGTDGQHGDIEALADARRALKKLMRINMRYRFATKFLNYIKCSIFANYCKNPSKWLICTIKMIQKRAPFVIPCCTIKVLKKRNTVDWAKHMQQSLHLELKAIKNPNI